jgi:hypothetical protein
MLRVDGMGWVMREWRDEVLLGMMRLLSASRVTGRASRSPVRGRVNDAWVLSEGGMMADGDGRRVLLLSFWKSCFGRGRFPVDNMGIRRRLRGQIAGWQI